MYIIEVLVYIINARESDALDVTRSLHMKCQTEPSEQLFICSRVTLTEKWINCDHVPSQRCFCGTLIYMIIFNNFFTIEHVLKKYY